MKLPLEEAQARMDSYMGNLELGGMAITELPEGLTVMEVSQPVPHTHPLPAEGAYGGRE